MIESKNFKRKKCNIFYNCFISNQDFMSLLWLKNVLYYKNH